MSVYVYDFSVNNQKVEIVMHLSILYTKREIDNEDSQN